MAPCSRWRLLSWWSSLRLRVFGGYWISQLCSHDRRYVSRSTCSALPPVSRLSVVLGVFSFWLGFGLCLTILLATWGCQRAYCGPHCGSESARVLTSLLSLSPSGVRHLYRLFLSWRLCRSRSLIPSLAFSWWCPCPLMRWALLTLSGYVLSVPSAFSLRRSRWSISSHCRPSCAVSLLTVSVICERSLLRRGVSPCVGFRQSPWGFAVAPPISPYTGPG